MTLMGDRLRIARKARGMSVREMARRLGVQHPWISAVEAGKSESIHSQRLLQWCRELGVSVDWVLGTWENWTPEQEGEDSEVSAAIA